MAATLLLLLTLPLPHPTTCTTIILLLKIASVCVTVLPYLKKKIDNKAEFRQTDEVVNVTDELIRF